MKHAHLQSVLTAAIVDYCQNNDLYLAELHIQGTVCISSDGAPTLVTQLSEKVSTTNNNRWVGASHNVRTSPVVHQPRTENHRPEHEELNLTRYEQSGARSPPRKHRRKSDPGHRSIPRYSNEFHRDMQSFRWSVDSIPETVSSKYLTTAALREELRREDPRCEEPRRDDSHPDDPRHNDPSPERRLPYHHGETTGQAGYGYKTPKEEPLDSGHKHLPPHTVVHDIGTKQVPHQELGTEGRPISLSNRAEEQHERQPEAAQETWRIQREQAMSAAALAVYNYMHSPTYHSAADPRSAGGISGQGGLQRSGSAVEKEVGEVDRHDSTRHLQQQHLQHQQQEHHVPGSSATSSSTTTTSESGNHHHQHPHRTSPPPPSPRSHPNTAESHSIGSEPHSQPSTPQHPMGSPTYTTFRPSRNLPLSLPLDYTHHIGLTSPTSIKSEAEFREELHIVTRPHAPHVPSMVSPSAQAAASAMAALSGLQASIMPTGLPPPTTKNSPVSTAGTSASTTSGFSQGEPEIESPPLEEIEPEPEPSPSPESPMSETGSMDLSGMSAAGCLQIPDAPVNSHFRKMMLKSLQGKYKVLKTAEGRYKCPVCGVSYVYQPNLRKHLEKVHLGKSYKCEFCGQKFTSVQGYSFHRKVKHRDLMPYRCELCRDAFYSYTAFLQHKKRSHSNHPECIAITHSENLNMQKQRQPMGDDDDDAK